MPTWLNAVTVSALVRHAMTFVGGILVSSGIFDAGTVEQLSGAIVTIIGVVWSLIDKSEEPKK